MAPLRDSLPSSRMLGEWSRLDKKVDKLRIISTFVRESEAGRAGEETIQHYHARGRRPARLANCRSGAANIPRKLSPKLEAAGREMRFRETERIRVAPTPLYNTFRKSVAHSQPYTPQVTDYTVREKFAAALKTLLIEPCPG